jgi:hypothetical protein
MCIGTFAEVADFANTKNLRVVLTPVLACVTDALFAVAVTRVAEVAVFGLATELTVMFVLVQDEPPKLLLPNARFLDALGTRKPSIEALSKSNL